jgi:solute carrier family 41
VYVFSVGLPGGIGAVFVSRLSTDLHARGLYSNSGEGLERPLVTGTVLFAVGLPVLFTYLTFMYLVGWIDLPVLFLIVFVLAFCIAVSMPSTSRCATNC